MGLILTSNTNIEALISERVAPRVANEPNPAVKIILETQEREFFWSIQRMVTGLCAFPQFLLSCYTQKKGEHRK